MHYDIDYTSLPQEEKELKALADIKDFWSEERFEKITKAFRAEEKKSLATFEFMLDFSGVQGYPVLVYYKYVYQLNEMPEWPSNEEDIGNA